MSLKKFLVFTAAVYGCLILIFSFSYLFSGLQTEAKNEDHKRTSPVSSAPESVKIQSQTIVMYKGNRVALAQYLPDSGNFHWESNHNTVAAILQNGIIEAKDIGTCTVTAPEKSNFSFHIEVVEKQIWQERAYKLVVYKGDQTVVIYDKDQNGEYTVPVKIMLCASGSVDAETRTGNYSFQNKYRWRLLEGPSYGQYATSFSGMYLFHSMPYDRTAEDTMWENSYELLGEKSSHGCIRLALRDSKWIYDYASMKSKVYITEDFSPFFAPTAIPFLTEERYKGWDPTDISQKNPYWQDGLSKEPVAYTATTEITLATGSSFKLNVNGTAENYIYHTNNSDIAAVDTQGRITALAEGECIIYAIGNDGGDCRVHLTVSRK